MQTYAIIICHILSTWFQNFITSLLMPYSANHYRSHRMTMFEGLQNNFSPSRINLIKRLYVEGLMKHTLYYKEYIQ